MAYLQRPFGGSKIEESFSKDLSFSRGGSSSGMNSSARIGRASQEFQGSFSSFRQTLREQVTNNLQKPLRQGSPYRGTLSTSESSNKFFPANRISEQKNLFSSPKESLAVSTNRNNMLFSKSGQSNDTLSFKKRIADSVASRLSPGKQHGEDSPLMIKKRKSIKEEAPGAHSDIWGLKMANPTSLTLSAYSPLKNKLGTNAPNSNSPHALNKKLSLASDIEALNRIRKSSTKEHAIARTLQETAPSSKMSFGSALFTEGTPINSPSSGSALLSLKEELARKKLISSPISRQKETVESKVTPTGAISRLRSDSEKKANSDKATTSKLTVTLNAPDLKQHNSVKPKEENKSNHLFSSLSQELDKIRSESLLSTSSPKNSVLDRIGTLSKNFATNSIQDDKSEKDIETPQNLNHQPKKNEIRKPAFTEMISLKRLYEMQDLLAEVSEKEFNELPSSYVEEMTKLSTSIMQRVKSSNHYSKKE